MGYNTKNGAIFQELYQRNHQFQESEKKLQNASSDCLKKLTGD